MQDRFKFRFWHTPSEKMLDCYGFNEHYTFADTLDGIGTEYNPCKTSDCILMQCTGLKDKNGLNRLFEYDIIDGEGIKIGNYYENKDLLKTTTNYLIKRMGTKEWRNSEQEAIKRGCFYAE